MRHYKLLFSIQRGYEDMINILHSKMNQFDYDKWAAYFAKNDAHRLNIDFSQELKLSTQEKKLIFPSIRAFQKGEGSDGHYLMKIVNEYVYKNGYSAYKDAMQWFIKEENWHSAYLKKYMDFHKVKSMKHSFLDHVFRKLRQSGGLKSEIIILVTAEMIALTYYDALAEATESPALKSICKQMLHDELPHIMFQSHTLSRLRLTMSDHLLRLLLMIVTSLFVWMAFHRLYRTGGYSFYRFMKDNLGYLWQSMQLSKKGKIRKQ